MHVSGQSVDLNWLVRVVVTISLVGLAFLHIVKNAASKYFDAHAAFSAAPSMSLSACVVCASDAAKKCSRCKAVRYCSVKCQQEHWNSGHKNDCKAFQRSDSLSSAQNGSCDTQFRASGFGTKKLNGIALVPARGMSKSVDIKQPKEILFPYEEFVKLFSWEKEGFPPCGLLNCGNSCFVNVVLQCLSSTRPLVAYLLEKGHRPECIRNDWCFLCELQIHIERASQSSQAFSPTNIISRLTNIGGNLGYGRQEDAHEFMRFAIDTMQSVCLDEFGGEKAVPPSSQETTIIQHIFGGQLQSQVICTKCENISNQYENMMDLTVEIHGEAASLEECLDQFTVQEWLHGENMYKCDGCNDYVKAWKRLTVKRAPNILTIALKRFQSGRFGKLNKRVTFPENLDLSPYMSDAGDGTDIYKLYAVVVHLDMLNASYFGHYICYVKDLAGDWYRLDDCKVAGVDLEEVLSQGAYMLLYKRIKARPSCLKGLEPLEVEQRMINGEAGPEPIELVKEHSDAEHLNHTDVAPIFESESYAVEELDGGEVVDMSSPSVSSASDASAEVSPSAKNYVFDWLSRDVVENVSLGYETDSSVSDGQAREEATVVIDLDMDGCGSGSYEIYGNGPAVAEKGDGAPPEEANEDFCSLPSVNSQPDIRKLKRDFDADFEAGENDVKSVDISDDSS